MRENERYLATFPDFPLSLSSLWVLAIPLLFLPNFACKGPGAPEDVDVQITATGGVSGSGGADDGVDETGDDPSAVEGECLFDEEPGAYGYKYQCVGEFTIEILVNDLEPEFLSVSFGQADSPDSYEEPHVMACCPLLGESLCEEPHTQACVVDMVEQGCKSLVPRIEELANDRPLLKGPILKTAEWVAQGSSQGACMQAFLFETAIGTTEPSCDEDNNSAFDFDGALEGTTWAFNPDTTDIVNQVRLTILDPEVWNATSPTDPPQTCTSSNENDHLSFLEIDPTIGDVKAELMGGTLELSGPTVDGVPVSAQASLSSVATTCSEPHCSRVAWSMGPNEGELHALSLYSGQLTELDLGSDALMVDAFQLSLFTPAEGMVHGDTLTIPEGKALFVASAEALGEHQWVTAWNATPIQIHGEAEGGSIDTFVIDYQDAAGDIWSVKLLPSTWQ